MEYKQYFRITLPVEELKKMNRYSPEGVKYCNAVCQDYREINEFSGNVTKKAICNTCRSIIGKVKKAIENKQMTLDKAEIDNHKIKTTLNRVEARVEKIVEEVVPPAKQISLHEQFGIMKLNNKDDWLNISNEHRPFKIVINITQEKMI